MRATAANVNFTIGIGDNFYPIGVSSVNDRYCSCYLFLSVICSDNGKLRLRRCTHSRSFKPPGTLLWAITVPHFTLFFVAPHIRPQRKCDCSDRIFADQPKMELPVSLLHHHTRSLSRRGRWKSSLCFH